MKGVSTHGTGCTYSAAISAGLARGLKLPEAVKLGKDFITNAIAIDQLANNGRTSHLAKRRQGRTPTSFTADELRDAKAIWRNVKDYPTWEDAAAAFPKGFTTARAFRLWKWRT